MRRIIDIVAGLFFLVVGPINFYLGVWGEMYTNPEFYDYLGYLQLYVLRPLLIVSIFCLPLGLWLLAPPVWRWMLGNLWEALEHEEWMDGMYYDDLCEETKKYGAPRATLWNRPRRMLSLIWYARWCFLGRHPEDELWYSDGGEDGPRGTTCGRCDRKISLDDVTPQPDRGPRRGDFVVWDNEPLTHVSGDPFRPWPPRCDKEG